MTLSFLDILPLKTKKLRKDDTLFRQGDKTYAMFVLQEGQVKLHRYNENGDQIIIHHAQNGETFAEAALFSNQYHCDAVMVENSQVRIIDKTQILTEMQQNSKFSLALSAHFARQIQTLRRRLEIQSIRSANKRVMVAMSEGILDADIKSFAAKIGLSHEATYRALSNLTQKNKITKISHGRYQLKKG